MFNALYSRHIGFHSGLIKHVSSLQWTIQTGFYYWLMSCIVNYSFNIWYLKVEARIYIFFFILIDNKCLDKLTWKFLEKGVKKTPHVSCWFSKILLNLSFSSVVASQVFWLFSKSRINKSYNTLISPSFTYCVTRKTKHSKTYWKKFSERKEL